MSKVPTAQGPPSRRLTGSDGADTAGLRGLRVPIEGSIAGRVFRAGGAEDVDSIASIADVVAAEPALAEHPGYGPTLVGLAPHSLAAQGSAARPGERGARRGPMTAVDVLSRTLVGVDGSDRPPVTFGSATKPFDPARTGWA